MFERIGVGLLVGLFGWFTGLLIWLLFHRIPGLGPLFFFRLSLILGIVSFFLGLTRPEATIDFLGAVGRKADTFWREVWRWLD